MNKWIYVLAIGLGVFLGWQLLNGAGAQLEPSVDEIRMETWESRLEETKEIKAYGFTVGENQFNLMKRANADFYRCIEVLSIVGDLEHRVRFDGVEYLKEFVVDYNNDGYEDVILLGAKIHPKKSLRIILEQKQPLEDDGVVRLQAFKIKENSSTPTMLVEGLDTTQNERYYLTPFYEGDSDFILRDQVKHSVVWKDGEPSIIGIFEVRSDQMYFVPQSTKYASASYEGAFLKMTEERLVEYIQTHWKQGDCSLNCVTRI
ncbi:MAG: hypothetical protein GY810_08065 [Aureispira sp.]|nr:hypothetical protein [Aureispira sp.]